MMRRMWGFALVLTVAVLTGTGAFAMDSGLFRTIPVDTPPKGILWVSNTSFYSPIKVNSILRTRYGVSDSKVFTSLSHASLGLTNRIALTGSFPFYADTFTQGSRDGEKTGPGDVSVGLRMSLTPKNITGRGFTIGAGVTIPEEMGFGNEPLGFRTFSTGEFSYNAELSFGFNANSFEGYFSGVYHGFPNAPVPGDARSTDVFYESTSGYLGIGREDAIGRADVIYQNHFTLTAGTAVPVNSWFAGIVEVSTSSFTEEPERDTILRMAPGFRLGKPESIHLAAGMDFKLSGDIPVRTFMFQFTIPFLRPEALIGIPDRRRPSPRDLVRSRNSLVAVTDFSTSDMTFPYEENLKHEFLNELKSMGIMEVVREKRTDASFARMRLVPRRDKPERIGVRLGANYLINTDISDYTIERYSSFSIPYIIGLPRTSFSLKANASVTDLVTGKTRNLGEITARIERPRGVIFFSNSPSSDLVHLSEPERRTHETELIDQWVKRFNDVILENLDVFGWEPKRSEIRGDEESSG